MCEATGADGASRYDLRVAPHVGPVDPQSVQDFFVRAISAGHPNRAVMGRLLATLGSFNVVRRAPAMGAGGKIVPVVVRAGGREAAPATRN